jgi:chemotaxis protein MotD
MHFNSLPGGPVLAEQRSAIHERPPVFSVTPEPAVSNSPFAPQAKQPRADQAPSDGFAALVESNTTAASESRSAPDTPLPPRRDQHEARRSDAPPANNDAPRRDTSSVSNDNPSSGQQDTDPAAPKDAAASGDKTPGEVKASGDKTSEGEKTQDAATDPSIADPATAATEAVAVIVAVVTAPVTTPGSGDAASPAPEVIAASAAAATAAMAAASSPASQDDPAQAKTPTTVQTAGTSADAATEPVAAAPSEAAAPEAAPTQILVAAGSLNSAPVKTGTSEKHAETTAAAKESKDGTQAADKSSAATVTDQAVKPESSASDGGSKPEQQDKAEASGAPSSEHAGKTASRGEHRASAPAPLVASQPDPVPQSPALMPQQPVQTLAANLTAIPVAPAQTMLAADTPVPLNGLAADIALRAAGGNSRFEIRLDPAELGRIDVRLDVDKHGNVTSHLTVERPATLDMLRNDAPRLQQALQDAGLKTGDSGLQFSLRDQSSSGQNSDNGSGRNSQRVIITDEDTVPAQIAGRTYGRMLGSSGGVDIRI